MSAQARTAKNVLIPPANLSLLVCSRENPVLRVEEVFLRKKDVD